MVKVVNMRTCFPPWGQPGDVRIDRKTQYGNPFQMADNSLMERDRVCEEYRKWFYANMDTLDTERLLAAKRLGCWCKPKRCHGDILKEYIDSVCSGSSPSLWAFSGDAE